MYVRKLSIQPDYPTILQLAEKIVHFAIRRSSRRVAIVLLRGSRRIAGDLSQKMRAPSPPNGAPCLADLS
jgi:hypothetical protein